MAAERWKPSVTVAAIASRPRRGTREVVLEYLLVEEETPEGLRLNNPAGHLDPGESPAEAVVREALEETARVFVPESIVGLYLTRADRGVGGAAATYLRIAFAGRVGATNPRLALDAGIVRTLWMTLDELRAARAPSQQPGPAFGRGRRRGPRLAARLDLHRPERLRVGEPARGTLSAPLRTGSRRC